MRAQSVPTPESLPGEERLREQEHSTAQSQSLVEPLQKSESWLEWTRQKGRERSSVRARAEALQKLES